MSGGFGFEEGFEPDSDGDQLEVDPDQFLQYEAAQGFDAYGGSSGGEDGDVSDCMIVLSLGLSALAGLMSV